MTQNIFLLLSKTLWSRNNSCYSYYIYFSSYNAWKHVRYPALISRLSGVIIQFRSSRRYCHSWQYQAAFAKSETKKKEHSIISSRVISSLMGPMYIETPYTINAKKRSLSVEVANVVDCDIVESSNFSRDFTFTFGLIPFLTKTLGKGVNPLIHLSVLA